MKDNAKSSEVCSTDCDSGNGGGRGEACYVIGNKDGGGEDNSGEVYSNNGSSSSGRGGGKEGDMIGNTNGGGGIDRTVRDDNESDSS